ncbi:MAG: hypothetical protein ACRDD8_07665 [Bacteroidales bacterium]
MKKLTIFILVHLCLLACSQDTACLNQNADAHLSLTISTKVNNANSKVTIQKRRILIFDMQTGNIVQNQSVIYPSESIDIIPVFSLTLREGSYKLVCVCNETESLSKGLIQVNNTKDIASLSLSTPLEDKELVLYGESQFMIRAEGNENTPSISLDNGQTWIQPKLSVMLERVASKFSFFIRKQTDTDTDIITINRIELVNLANQAHLERKPYEGELSTRFVFEGEARLEGNASTFQKIVDSEIMNEYLLINKQDEERCTGFRISATYQIGQNEPMNVVYYSPILLSQEFDDYSINRNCHYRVGATIKSAGEIEYISSIGYDVQDWEDAGGGNVDIGGVITVGKKEWVPETVFNSDGSVNILANTNIAFEFSMASPIGARWIAMLTNNIDFEFDLMEDGVREGVTREGVINKIKVKPKRIVSSLEGPVTTEFYILIDNGDITELDLNDDYQTGKGSRYLIRQRPSE